MAAIGPGYKPIPMISGLNEVGFLPRFGPRIWRFRTEPWVKQPSFDPRSLEMKVLNALFCHRDVRRSIRMRCFWTPGELPDQDAAGLNSKPFEWPA